LEKITGALLEKDLLNSESLAHLVMFDQTLREHVFDEMDGARACWERKKLAQRLHINHLDGPQKQAVNGCGTLFFWGVNDSGRKIPLYLEADASNGERLSGVDDRDTRWEIPFNPQSIIHELQDNRLLPSLFTSFLALSFARGVACAGGYFQGEYLPAMQKGIVNALQKMKRYHNVAHLVSKVPTGLYLSGMLAVMTRIEEGYLIPSGPVEIIAGGGITGDDIEQMLSLTVRDAHLAALFETVPDIVPAEMKLHNWKAQLAADCSRLLEEKILVK